MNNFQVVLLLRNQSVYLSLTDSRRRLLKAALKEKQRHNHEEEATVSLLWKSVNATVTAGPLETGSIFTSIAEQKRPLKGFFSSEKTWFSLYFQTALARNKKNTKPPCRHPVPQAVISDWSGFHAIDGRFFFSFIFNVILKGLLT